MASFVVLFCWFMSLALAGGSATTPPPAPPTVDFAGLEASAVGKYDSPDGKEHPVFARLLLDRTKVAPGGEARVGLYLHQKKGWHTYWKSPGDIGQPTDIAWKAPVGATITPHVYPVPQRFEQDGMVSFGYEDQVLLIANLKVPKDAAPGDHPLTGHASWLVCKELCIPGEVDVAMTLHVGADGETSVYAPVFDHFAKQHPTPPLEVQGVGFEWALSASAVRPNDTFKAVIKATPTNGKKLSKGDTLWPTFTPIVSAFNAMVSETSVKETPDGGLIAVVEAIAFEPDPLPSTPDPIGGLFQLKVGDTWIRTEVEIPAPWAATDSKVDHSVSPLWKLAGVEGVAPEPTTDGAPEENKTVLASVSPTPPPAADMGGAALLLNLVSAFIGGLILNVMPCVLPVLTLKLYSLIEQTDITAKEQRTAGLAYTGGIIASFWALAATIVVMRSIFGLQVDWGFQFQYPPYVGALATVVFAFGLSLFGVFEIPAFGANQAAEATSKEGVAGYFFTGVFATLLATPCSAPFLGTAIAFAFGAPTIVLFLIFSMVGLGLAAPFLLIALIPALYRFLPKPGEWMDGFKQLLGFTLIATTIWLVDVLIAQIGGDRAVGFMAFLMFVAMGCWVFGRWGGLAASGRQQLIAASVGTAISVGAGMYFLDFEFDEVETCDDGELVTELDFGHEVPWQAFSEQRVASLQGTPVFIDFTADWCLTCKVNEKAILETETVRFAMRDHGIVPLKADWTRRDPVITEWLRRHGRAGVPMYLVVPSDPAEAPFTLPEVITQDLVVTALEKVSIKG
jgi:thiol:disulfide interchange protein